MKHLKKILALIVAILLAVTLTACDRDRKNTSSDDGQKLKDQSYAQQAAAVPFPVEDLRDSLERRNLRERLLRQNDADKIGYVYILSFGKFLGYYTITGKVSSTQSQMTPEDLTDYACDDGLSGCQAQVLSAPGDDGSYGENETGVFFFTTEGAMVQVSTEYIYSDQPIAVTGISKLG